MNDFLKSLPRRETTKKRKKRKRYPFLPYDPGLADFDHRLTIPKDLRIELGHVQQPALVSSNDELQLLRRRAQPGSHPKNQASKVLTTEEDKIRHLLSRASFGITVKEMKSMGSPPVEDVIDALLTDLPMPDPPDDWVSEPFDINAYRQLGEAEQMAFLRLNNQRINELRGWWLQLMMNSSLNLRERMTLFWHGHFTSDLEAGILAQFLFKQVDTLRSYALGNFGHFAKAIYKDPTMLLYLDGANNIAQQPNENFARELLELFTMGVGNYTEMDIKEAARAFTGWQADLYNIGSFLNPNLHDHGIKTFLGQTGNFGGDQIIDIILQQPETANHICRKLYEHFISREIDEAFVNDLANTFRSNNYEIKPVLRSIFSSDFFYSEDAVASLIKAPIEMAAQNARSLSAESVDLFFVLYTTAILDQELLNPPNVAGWPGQRSWISPTTYVTRNTINEAYVNPELIRNDSGQPYVRFDALAFARSFEITGARELAAAMIRHLLRMPISEETLDFLTTVLVGSADPDDWSLDYPGADRLVTACLVQIIRLPEFHLT